MVGPSSSENSRRVISDTASCRHRSFPLKQPVGCIALTEDPNIILAALEREVVTINLKTQTQER